ncbi:hypothetical protein CKO28_05015 [Rhodovibrio sodomensis]|uniref:Uncharacterized protein n=1 Tax=Rhodovibrio sodomensis TaxID=1088 RepID=A0ABS1DAC0_9PROT|nr:hypothetical protein [Rhodovibrio sodomensis]MBK1667389.1 hypothetical protein [Rhodovibrio sodomensis]
MPPQNQDLPQPGDVILAYPPERETADQPGRRAQPVLVLACTKVARIDGTDALKITVARGRASNLDRLFPGELTIASPEGMQAAGLTRARKFDLTDQVEMPYNRQHAIFGRAGTPVLGRLSAADMQAARVAYGRANNVRRVREAGGLPKVPALLPDLPRAGDIAYLYAPYHDAPDRPGPKARPCIITGVQIRKRPDGSKRCFVRFCPGTTQKLWMQRPGDLTIEGDQEIADCGIGKAGKFQFAKETMVEWTPAYVAFKGNSPILGKLTPELYQKARKLRAAVAAHRDVRPPQAPSPEPPKTRRGETTPEMIAQP